MPTPDPRRWWALAVIAQQRQRRRRDERRADALDATTGELDPDGVG